MLNNELWSAIYDLYELLIEKCNAENRYQSYFEKHKIVFSVLGLEQPYSFEKSSSNSLPYDKEIDLTPEPDFIAKKTQSSTLSIVELKTPFVSTTETSRADGNRSKMSAMAESYISQSTEYARSITEREIARDYLKELFNIETITDVEVILIYGLASESKPDKIEKLLANRAVPTKIIFFDSLMDKLVEQYQSAMQVPVGMLGLTAIYHLSIEEQQVNKLAVLSEGQSEDGCTLRFTYSNKVVSLILIDKTGKSHVLESSIPTNELIYIKLEFCNNQNGIFMSLNVNNEIQDLKVSKVHFNFTYDNNAFSIGASLTGHNGICFSMHEHYFSSNIFDYKDRLGSYHYFKKKSLKTDKLVFEGKQFFLKNASGMVQDNPLFQPKYRK
jgi:hypothetical protein